ncbi:hypothetical protein [Dyadobacter sp.]|uniref:hypothetical protein n=1 Tax=Dyadobacter sp. TaxID=1914288 RepID=UPI003F6F9157
MDIQDATIPLFPLAEADGNGYSRRNHIPFFRWLKPTEMDIRGAIKPLFPLAKADGNGYVGPPT